MTAAIPSSGTWEIFTQVNAILASGQEACYGLFDATGTLVTNTEGRSGYIGNGATFQGQGSSAWIITTVGAVNYTIRTWAPGANANMSISSDSVGRTYVTWKQLSGGYIGATGMTGPTGYAGVGATQTYYASSSQSIGTSIIVNYNTLNAGSSYNSLPLTNSSGTFTNTSATTLNLAITANITLNALPTSLVYYQLYVNVNGTIIQSSYFTTLQGSVSASFALPPNAYFTIVQAGNTNATSTVTGVGNTTITISQLVAGPMGPTGYSGVPNWTSLGAIIFGATTTAPTVGTTTRNTSYYRQIGTKQYAVMLSFLQTTTGTSGSGDYLFTLPNGLSWDTSISNQQFYTGSVTSNTWAIGLYIVPSSDGIITNGSTSGGQTYAVPYNATQYRICYTAYTQSTACWGSGFYALGANSLIGVNLWFEFQST